MMCVLRMSEAVVIANQFNHMADRFGHLHDFFGANTQIMNDCQMLIAEVDCMAYHQHWFNFVISMESSHNGKQLLQSSLVSVQQYLVP